MRDSLSVAAASAARLPELGYRRGDFPAAEAMADTVLSLPMHPHLTHSQARRVAAAVQLAVARV